ncbi:MAG: peroxiredoxin-like family protein [Chloroflexota bacterium]
MKKITLLTALFLFITGIAAAQETNYAALGIDISGGNIPKGLNEGDKAPDFTGYDQAGKQVTLKSFLEKGPVVMFFYRGNWCPACNKQLQAYQDSLRLITDQGFTLVAITPESIEHVEQTVKMHNLAFQVIYDCQEKIMQDYGLMFDVTKDFQNLVMKSLKISIAEHNGREAAHLPIAATYIINKNGYLTSRYFDPDFHHRASVNWIMRKMATAM